MSRREEIKKTAVGHLLQYGYEGTKLADIAREVGIKKQSMYAHFENKKNLVVEIHENATKQEIAYLTTFFHEHKGEPLRTLLRTFVEEMKDRYATNRNVKLMFLMAFMPPEPLQELCITMYELYSHHLLHQLELAFQLDSTLRVNPKEGALAVHTIYEGLTTKLIFDSPDYFIEAAETTFSLLWKGILYREDS
ncbi:TetR/AcrR family transcriptional regulator [Paenibacillus sp. MZ04-78.2]|uniref:TetR/AcrR family transcriptional regulator n=1 Tax=Paenibacillus sp. MZ04-78.2 TaxID=2962034 RepID=UPI0020B6385B|nr:TetR/AcrR family transcriptional regulator [Paenibacillus sp. MZ04-78.2]MCP3772609.1 TetR/AcrR family transcriptional regulator [Paenibacillus sp. MZ04-78.2]